MHLLPLPKEINRRPGHCNRPKNIKRRLTSTNRPEPDSYHLVITKAGIALESATPAGLFYAGQTLLQIREQSGARLPCLEILDWPDYPTRGFYHDVSRGKVPTLKTLLQLAETCARYKLNQLQLYIEHTYAFKNHREVWQGADPLTAPEIRALDARCAELHIDLVPSFSTFGHFYTWIHHKYPELNELERDVSGEPFCWWDRMAHYTLDCQNPRSFELVREIIQEVRPLFRSRYFNICADETFDLGLGRNAALAKKVDKGKLYVDFLGKVMGAVKEAGAIPMFWGDIIGHHPELLPRIPEEAIALDWDYGADLAQSQAKLMQKSRRPFYVCPGVSSWNAWLPNYATGYKNITGMARLGCKHGAIGLLNTDWGDYGHIQTLGPTLPGLLLGAAASWNIAGTREDEFNRAVSKGLLGDATGKLLGLLSKFAASAQTPWSLVCWMHQPRSKDFPDNWFDATTGIPNGLLKQPTRVHLDALKKMRALAAKIEPLLAGAEPKDKLLIPEVRVGLLGLQVMEEIQLVLHHRAGKFRVLSVDPRVTAKRVRALDRDLARVWKKRNKPSELHRLREVLGSIATDLAKKKLLPGAIVNRSPQPRQPPRDPP